MLEIHEPADTDREAIALINSLAFNFNARAEDISLDGALCAFEGTKLVGASQAIALGQWFGGARVPCAGVSSVAVLPEHRGRGVASTLMRQLLEHQRRQGDAVSALYPANSQLYRHLGYEFAGLRPEFRAQVTDLPPAKGEVVELAENDIGTVMACFSEFASNHNGPVESRDPVRWAYHVLAHKGEGTLQRTAVVPGPGGLGGYASYFMESGPFGGFRVTCKHLVALNPPALRALLGYFRRFENAASELAWFGPPGAGPFGFALASSGFSIVPTMRRWMGRILDVPSALELRGYPPEVAGSLVIRVDDALFPANEGPWELHVANGRMAVAPASGPHNGRSQAPLPVGLLSALYTGLAAPHDLVVMGALDRDDPRLGLLSALFYGPVPWMPDFF